jgi:hypothetical protein
MADDFGYCWRTVRLYCPAAPTFLAREWVNAAYKQLLSARHWGFLRAELVVNPLETDTHLTVPADFGAWKVIVDPSRQVRICFNHSLEELAKIDPALTNAGQVLALVADTPSTDPLTLGRTRYLYYPHGSSSTLRAVYHRGPARLDDNSVFPGVLATGGEVLVAGALAQAALWPGTPDKPNPYFNAGLAQNKAQEFKIGIQGLSLRDDEQYPDDLWDSWPESCDCLEGGDYRTTDASVSAYHYWY